MNNSYNGFLYQAGCGKSKVKLDYPKEIEVKGITSLDISKIDFKKIELIKKKLQKQI